MRTYRIYTKEELELAVKNSLSWRQVILLLNPNNKGYRGSESNIKTKAKNLGIDFSHFPGAAWNKGRRFPNQKTPIEDYFSNKTSVSSDYLKNRLISDKIKKEQCELCKSETWFDTKIPLELHHKDANSKNNCFDNLEILCPNCHAYRHKSISLLSKSSKAALEKKKAKNQRRTNKDRNRLCEVCKSPAVNKFCSYNCSYSASRKVVRPSKEELSKMVWEISCSKIAEKFDVSDNAVAKWCKAYEIKKPGRGYWMKLNAINNEHTSPN